MTSDEAREAFDEAFEGALGAERRAAFDAAIAADAALRAEWDEFVRTMRMVRGVGLDEVRQSHEPLLAGVQSKLRARSRGRFYRDRFASAGRSERMLPILLAVATILLLGIAWAGHHVVDVAPVRHGAR